MKIRASLGLALLCASIAVAEQDPAPVLSPWFPDLQTTDFEGGKRIDLLGIPLLGYAAPKLAGGTRAMVLLTAAELVPRPDADAAKDDEPGSPCDDSSPTKTALYRLDFDRVEPSVTLLRDDLPGDATSLEAFDLDGDGIEELLLFRPGQMLALRASGGQVGGAEPLSLVEDAELDRKRQEPSLERDSTALESSLLQVSGIGAARYYRPATDATAWSQVAETELQVKAGYSGSDFYVFTIPPTFLGRSAEGKLTFAGNVEEFGSQRLKTVLIHPETGTVEECWARLPEPESTIRKVAKLLNGKPVLIVTSRSADEFGLFDEQLLRIFPLAQDRSRAGRAPLLAFKTRMNLINDVEPQLLDVDRDGLQDLVFGYWQGFDRDHLVLDVHLQEPGGSFRSAVQTTDLKVKNADSSFLSYGTDIDGDGRSDLLLMSSESLWIYRGSAKAVGGKRLVEKSPSISVPLGVAATSPDLQVIISLGGGTMGYRVTGPAPRPQTLDLDGDGRYELLLAVRNDSGSGQLTLVLLDPPAN